MTRNSKKRGEETFRNETLMAFALLVEEFLTLSGEDFKSARVSEQLTEVSLAVQKAGVSDEELGRIASQVREKLGIRLIENDAEDEIPQMPNILNFPGRNVEESMIRVRWQEEKMVGNE